MTRHHHVALLAALLVLFVAGASHAQGDLKCEVLVKSGSAQPQTFTYALTSAQAFELDNEPARVAQMAAKAKSDYAAKLGYSTSEFGNQNWKVVPGVKVARVTVVHSDGRRDDVLIPETRR